MFSVCAVRLKKNLSSSFFRQYTYRGGLRKLWAPWHLFSVTAGNMIQGNHVCREYRQTCTRIDRRHSRLCGWSPFLSPHYNTCESFSFSLCPKMAQWIFFFFLLFAGCPKITLTSNGHKDCIPCEGCKRESSPRQMSPAYMNRLRSAPYDTFC